MVGIMAWKAKPIGKQSMLTSLKKLVKSLCLENNLKINDIGLIIHTGTFRQNFRAEPAFATHLQKSLKIGLGMVNNSSEHVFSFDLMDGSAGPHQAIEAAIDFLPNLKTKYALITAGDVKPNKKTKWSHKPISFACIISNRGRIEFLESEFDYSVQNDYKCESKGWNIYENMDDNPNHKVHNISDNHFYSSSEWLAGEQMEKFLSWAENKTGELIHTINDRSGRKSTIYWKVH